MKVNLKNLEEAVKKSKLRNEVKIRKILEDGSLEEAEREAIEVAMRLLSMAGASEETISEVAALAGVGAPVESMEEMQKDMEEKDEEIAKQKKTIDESEKVIKELKARVKDADDDQDLPVTKEGNLDIKTLKERGASPVVIKSLQQLWTNNKESEARVTKIQKQLEEEREQRVTKEYENKADEYSNLPIKKEDLAVVLKSHATSCPESYERLENLLGAVNVGVKKSGAFTEFGVSAPEMKEGSPEAIEEQIKKEAMEQPICKEKQMTEAQAETYFITKTQRGRQLYADLRALQN